MEKKVFIAFKGTEIIGAYYTMQELEDDTTNKLRRGQTYSFSVYVPETIDIEPPKQETIEELVLDSDDSEMIKDLYIKQCEIIKIISKLMDCK